MVGRAAGRSKKAPKRRKVTAAKAPKLYEEQKFSVSIPKSMVVTTGAVTKSLRQLMHDTRKMLLPWTAKNLKVSRKNVLKDFLHVASPLHISHVFDFSQSGGHVLLRIGYTRGGSGPTFAFAVEEYSLMSDVRKHQTLTRNSAVDHKKPPVMILQGFASTQPESPLSKRVISGLAACLGGMFPRHDFKDTELLTDLRRVALFQFDGLDRIRVRHYGTLYPVSKDANVPLVEIGPRMDLRLLRVYSGAFQGDIIYNVEDSADYAKLDNTVQMTDVDWKAGEKAAAKAERLLAKQSGLEVSDDEEDDDEVEDEEEREIHFDIDNHEDAVTRYRTQAESSDEEDTHARSRSRKRKASELSDDEGSESEADSDSDE